jgi:TatA/E family protein of Tat protein translocase
MIGSQDLLIALALGLLLFGAKKLPELARGLGESLKEFKRATTQPDPPPPPAPVTPAPPSASATAPGRRCPNCQTELQADWAHCPRCGTAGPGG